LDLGSNLAANLSTPIKNAIRTRLGIASAFVSNSLVDVLWEILTTKADPTGLLRCKPLMPTVQRALQLLLGGFSMIREGTFSQSMYPLCLQVVKQDWHRLQRECGAAKWRLDAEGLTWQRLHAQWLELKEVGTAPESPTYKRLHDLIALPEPEHHRRNLRAILEQYRLTRSELEVVWGETLPTPLPHSTTLTENWNCADSGSPNCQLTWTLKGASDFDIITNAAEAASNDDTMDNTSDLASADHYAQVKLLNVIAEPGDTMGVRARSHPTDDTQYRAWNDVRAGTDAWNTSKRVLGTDTAIGAETLVEIVAGDVIKVQADGSSISRYRNGALQETLTDTSITGNLRTGVEVQFTPGQRLDDFEVADLAAAAGQPFYLRDSHSDFLTGVQV
jgi:hypothetical protein